MNSSATVVANILVNREFSHECFLQSNYSYMKKLRILLNHEFSLVINFFQSNYRDINNSATTALAVILGNHKFFLFNVSFKVII